MSDLETRCTTPTRRARPARPGQAAGLLCAAILLGACAGPSLEQRHTDAKQALDALQAGRFETAEGEAARVVKADAKNPFARLVSAITRYKKSMHQLSTDVRTVVFGALQAGGFNHRYMRNTLTQTEADLGAVDVDLAAAAETAGVHVELCLACWRVDWNHNGRIDDRDRLVFQIEQDERGERLPGSDPRRKPTFRYDDGDILWARAFVAFQRAALDLLLAYKWTDLDKLLWRGFMRSEGAAIVIKMERPELVAAARARILEGLDFADQARRAYLAETDDDREWLPSPRQKSHPMPLPVDERLYTTWAEIVGDLKRLVRSEEGLRVEAVAQLGDHRWEVAPRGYVDVGRMLSRPKDIVLDIGHLKRLDPSSPGDVEEILRSILGEYYVPSMKASPITERLGRMKQEMKRGEETFERKLRYLIWLN